MRFTKRDCKRFICVFLAVLVVHAIKMVTYLPTYDSMYGMDASWTDGIEHGRWLRSIIFNITSSTYDLQWVQGVVAAVFLALTVHFILALFRVNSVVEECLIAGVFITFPSITAIFAYGFIVTGYTFGLLTTVLAVYLLIHLEKKRKYIYSALLLIATLAIYQVYFIFGFILYLYYFAFLMLKNEKMDKSLMKSACYVCLTFAVSLLIYWVLNKVVMLLAGTAFSSYMGWDSMGIMPIRLYFRAIYSTLVSFIAFFVPITKVSFYGILNILIALTIIGLFIKNVLLNRNYSIRRRVGVLVLFLLCVPGTYCFYFVSSGVKYHGIMEIGNYFVYFALIIIALLNKGICIKNIERKIVIVLLSVLCYYNFVNANVAYKQMEMSYSRTEFATEEILMYIDDVNDRNAEKVAVIGRFENGKEMVAATPAINAAYTRNFLTHPYHFFQFSKYYFGREYVECDESLLQEIAKTSEFAEMPCYPSKGCVRLIDDIIVIKLSEQ